MGVDERQQVQMSEEMSGHKFADWRYKKQIPESSGSGRSEDIGWRVPPGDPISGGRVQN